MNDNESLKDKIVRDIKEGRIAMHSRWSSIFKKIAIALGLLLSALLVLYLVSFVVFSIRVPVLGGVPFGRHRSLWPFLAGLPWLTIVLSIVTVILLERFLRYYKFGYRRPIVASLTVVVVLSILGTFWLERARFHDRFGDYSERRNVPFFRPLYRSHPRKQNQLMRTLQPVYGTTTDSTTSPRFFRR